MDLHLYTILENINKYENDQTCIAWSKEKYQPGDLHVSFDVGTHKIIALEEKSYYAITKRHIHIVVESLKTDNITEVIHSLERMRGTTEFPKR